MYAMKILVSLRVHIAIKLIVNLQRNTTEITNTFLTCIHAASTRVLVQNVLICVTQVKQVSLNFGLIKFIDGCNNRNADEPTVSVEIRIVPEVVDPERTVAVEPEVVEVDFVEESFPIAERESDSHAIKAFMSSILILILLTC